MIQSDSLIIFFRNMKNDLENICEYSSDYKIISLIFNENRLVNITLEYFDSFGEDPPHECLVGIKKIVDKLNPSVYMKMKINKIIEQRANSDSCGYLAIKFLLDRYKGNPFKDCTGYSDITHGEKEAKILKSKFKKFDLI